MPEKTVHTSEGEVSYETVTCSSCGDEVAEENARDLLIGDLTDEEHWSFGKHEYHFENGRPDIGKLCEVCHENPIAYPHKNDVKKTSRLHHLKRFITG